MNKYLIALGLVLVLLVGYGIGYLTYERPGYVYTCPNYNKTLTVNDVCEDLNFVECKVFNADTERPEREWNDNAVEEPATGYSNQQSECARLHNRSLC